MTVTDTIAALHVHVGIFNALYNRDRLGLPNGHSEKLPDVIE